MKNLVENVSSRSTEENTFGAGDAAVAAAIAFSVGRCSKSAVICKSPIASNAMAGFLKKKSPCLRRGPAAFQQFASPLPHRTHILHSTDGDF